MVAALLPAQSQAQEQPSNELVLYPKGHFKGGKNLVFNLKNNGVGVGKITPQITKKHPAWVKLMKQFKSKIIHHKLKVPAVLP